MTTTDQPNDGARWQGYSHKELYLMLHDGPGAAASAEPSRRWAEIAATLTEVGQDLKKAIEATNVAWSGPAAGVAYERLATTVVWAEDAGEHAGAMRTSVEDQAEHIAKARADMPKPEDVPAAQPDAAVAPAVQVVQTQTDAEAAEKAAASAELKAVEVMAAYEENTRLTTAAIATFEPVSDLVESTHLHKNKGGGLLGIVPTVVSGLLGVGKHEDKHHDNGRGERRDNWHSPNTSNSSARWEEARRPVPTAPLPGKIMGAAPEPLFAAAPGGNDDKKERQAGRGNPNSQAPAPGPKSGGANMSLPNAELQQQAAAASQAAGTPPPPGAPLAPATGGVPASQDKMALRRFGMEAIGSSQWFGDTEEPVVGESPKRRFDLRATADTENVTILDDESHLPPTVIGDGSR